MSYQAAGLNCEGDGISLRQSAVHYPSCGYFKVQDKAQVQFYVNGKVQVQIHVQVLDFIEWLFKAIPYIQPKTPTHPHPPTQQLTLQRQHLSKER